MRTAAAAQNAGPSVTIGFIIASIGCAFAGLCYAEFASMIPIAGSAYTYSYATMGEFIAWIIGWDLVLEYGVGAATVAIAWSEYFNKFLEIFGWHVPYQWSHSPFEISPHRCSWYHEYSCTVHCFSTHFIIDTWNAGIGSSKCHHSYFKSSHCSSGYCIRLAIHKAGKSYTFYS